MESIISLPDTRVQWAKCYATAFESDSWGQIVEAADAYEALLRVMSPFQNNTEVSQEDRAAVAKFCIVLGARLEELRRKLAASSGSKSPVGGSAVSVESMAKLKVVMDDLFIRPQSAAFPVDTEPLKNLQKTTGPVAQVTLSHAGEVGGAPDATKGNSLTTMVGARQGELQGGSLLPPPAPFATPGTAVTLRIEKIGLKDADRYFDSHITVSVHEGVGGRQIESPQDTPHSTERIGKHILFGCNVELQTDIRKWSKETAIFIEFKHYKPKKTKISTRCWTFIDMDELHQLLDRGSSVLELYCKPTDLAKKKIRLFTEKELYLHVSVISHEN